MANSVGRVINDVPDDQGFYHGFYHDLYNTYIDHSETAPLSVDQTDVETVEINFPPGYEVVAVEHSHNYGRAYWDVLAERDVQFAHYVIVPEGAELDENNIEYTRSTFDQFGNSVGQPSIAINGEYRQIISVRLAYGSVTPASLEENEDGEIIFPEGAASTPDGGLFYMGGLNLGSQVVLNGVDGVSQTIDT